VPYGYSQRCLMRLCSAEITPSVEVTDARARRRIKAGGLHGKCDARYFRRIVYSKQLRGKNARPIIYRAMSRYLFAGRIRSAIKGARGRTNSIKERHPSSIDYNESFYHFLPLYSIFE